MISPDHNHRIRIQLKTTDIHNIPARLDEIAALKEMLETIVEWQPNQYSFRIHSSGAVIEVWFKEEQHAMMCALGWS